MAGRVTKIYVGNIPESCKSDDLRSLFQQFGRIEECDVVKNFGFVHMSSEDEAKLAIEALNGSEFMGVKISVEASHSKVRPKPGMGGKGQCYRCGKSGHWSKECPRNANGERMGRGPPPMMPPPPPAYAPHDRFSRYGPIRYNPIDRGDYRPYSRPYPDPYDRRPPPPPPPPPPHRDDYHDYYYRRLPPPPPMYDEPPPYGYERRLRPERYDRGYDRGYSSYPPPHASRREEIY